MGRTRKVHWIRVFGFAATYFSIFTISTILYTIRSLSGSPDLGWYLEHFPYAAIAMLAELSRSPLMMLTLLQVILASAILGIVTDWAYRTIKRL